MSHRDIGAGDCGVLVVGLPDDADSEELREIFEAFGTVVAARVRRCNGALDGLVRFDTVQAATVAIASARDVKYRGRSLHVRPAGFVHAWGGCDGASSVSSIPETESEQPARTFPIKKRFQGRVEAWRGQHGWIVATERIEFPSVALREGRIFASAEDVEICGTQLSVGTLVSFIVFVNSKGVGAGEIRVEKAATNACSYVGPTASLAVQIWNWPVGLDEKDLRSAFERFGEVKSTRICRNQNGGSRVCGFLHFATLESSLAAIDGMDGILYGAEPLRLKLAPDSHTDYLGNPIDDAPDSFQEGHSVDVGSEDRIQSSDYRFTGILCAWKGHYGWIKPLGNMQFSDMARHAGFIYVHERDVHSSVELRAGSRVTFTSYVDADGIGAADVQPDRSSTRRTRGAGRGGRKGRPVQYRGPGPAQWWHELVGVCCPVSLMPLDKLDHEPFGLRITVDDDDDADGGVYGIDAVAAFLAKEPVHWFHGMFLACSIVSQGHLVDPLNMRPLSRTECVSLDGYLVANDLPDISVAAIFDILQDTQLTDAEGRLDELRGNAASWLAACRNLSADAEVFIPTFVNGCNEYGAAAETLIAPDSQAKLMTEAASTGQQCTTQKRRWQRRFAQENNAASELAPDPLSGT